MLKMRWMLATLMLISVAGCQPQKQEPKAPVQGASPAPSKTQQAQHELAHHVAYKAAIERAKVWLAKIPVESPRELRDKELKGKKKFVELLDTYARLYRIASAQERPALLARINQLEQITQQASYHDMNELDDVAFKQDATSYLRAAFLLERLGFDTSKYQEHIRLAKGRIDAHLPSRGSHQQMAFALYYEHFKLPFPSQIKAAPSLIQSRKDPYSYTILDAYHLTHEIFVPYEFGDKLGAQPFNPEELAYLERTIHRLLIYYMMRQNADLVAELLMCMKYLKREGSELYDEATLYLLKAQNDDGSWGRYQSQAKKYGEDLDVALYLHTVMVVIDALSLTMEPEPERWLQSTITHNDSP